MMGDIRKRIKKTGSTSRLLGIVALVVLAGLIQIIWNMDFWRFLFAKSDVVEFAPNWSENAFYTCNTNRLLDYYAADDDGYYFFNSYEDDNGDFKVMGLYVYNAISDVAMRIVDENAEMILPDEYTDVHLKGRGYVYSMSTQEQEYMREYFGEYLADYEDYLVYETFVLVPMGKILKFSVIISLLCSVAALGLAFYLMFSLITGRYMKKFDEALEYYHISENELERDMEYGDAIDNIDIGKKYLVAYTSNSEVIPFERLIWAYMHVQTTRHMMYGFIPMGSTQSHSLHLVTKDRKKHTITIANEENGQNVLKLIEKNAPYVIMGYDDQLNQIYLHNFNHMIQIVEEQKNKMD